MSWLDSINDDASIQNQSDNIRINTDPLKPRFFQGAFDAAGMGLVKGALKATDLAQTAWDIASDAGYEYGKPEKILELRKKRDEELVTAMKLLTPDPTQVGMAGQILHPLFDIGARAAAGALVGGPLGAASAASIPEYRPSKVTAMAEGMSENVATTKAVIDSAVNAIGVAIPAARLVANPILDAGATIGANVGLGIAQRGVTAHLLNSNGYKAQAEQYKALDATALVVDSVLGAAFHGVARLGTRPPTQEQINAALTENQERHLSVTSAIGSVTTPKGMQEHRNAVLQALDQMSRGEPVSVSPEVSNITFLRPDSTKKASVSETALRHLPEVQRVAEAQGLDPNILIAQIDVESRGISEAKSPKGAQGIAQFMPKTAKQYGVDVTNDASSIQGQAAYMKDLMNMFDGDVKKALAGYNWGQGNVQKAIKKYGDNWAEYIPKETKDYVRKILAKAGGDENTPRMLDARQATKDAYKALETSKQGKVLKGDDVASLLPEDLNLPQRDIDAHVDDLMSDLYREQLSTPIQELELPSVVEFTRGQALADSDIVYDGLPSVEKVQQALDSGRQVVIDHVVDNPVDILQRSIDDGSLRSIDELVDNYARNVNTMNDVYMKYQSNQKVTFNSERMNNIIDRNVVRNELMNVLDDEYRSGRITTEQYVSALPREAVSSNVVDEGLINNDSQSTIMNPTIVENQRVSSREVMTAANIAKQYPDMEFVLDDGSSMTLAEMMLKIDEDRATSEVDARAYDVAVNCYLRNS